MRKAQFVGAEKVDIIECERPTPNAGEVLVRVLRCALCGSDKRIWREGTANTPGHELVGIIEDPHSARNGERVLVYIPTFYLPISDLERNIPLLLNHQDMFSRMVDRIVPLERLEEAFRQFADGNLMKPIVNMEL